MSAGKDLKLELVRLVRKGYKDRAREVKVFTADPRTERDLPCVAVNRVYDSEDKMGFANEYEYEATADGAVEHLSGLFTQTCELRIWTENADQRDEMFVELKEILLLAKADLAALGFGEMSMKGGRDENDFRTYAPLFIYWGAMNFTALSPLDAERTDAEAKTITAVDTTKAIDGVEQTLSQL